MLRRLRLIGPSTGLLILVLFTAWLGAVSLHHHGTSPACEICKVLQGTQATLPGGPPALERHDDGHRLPAFAPAAGSESRASLHPGRAPPHA